MRDEAFKVMVEKHWAMFYDRKWWVQQLGEYACDEE
jgi:hypothetical protein